jgi:hypothetical protein
MTLKEKFRDKILSFLSDNMKEQNAIECEQIADDYAIEFAEWISKQEYNLDFWVRHNQTKNLLEIFKEEKGL